MNLCIPGVYLCRAQITADRFEQARTDAVALNNRPTTLVVHPSDKHDADEVINTPYFRGMWRVQPDADVTPGTFWLVDEVRIQRDGHDCDSAMRAATLVWWNRVYDLLMQYGAKDSTRGEFLDYHLRDGYHSGIDREVDRLREFRFMGRFGMGGKVWTHGMRSLHVSYYSEDRTPKRERDRAALNEALKAL